MMAISLLDLTRNLVFCRAHREKWSWWAWSLKWLSRVYLYGRGESRGGCLLHQGVSQIMIAKDSYITSITMGRPAPVLVLFLF